MKYEIIEDQTIYLFSEIAFHLKKELEKLGITAEIKKYFEGDDKVFFILNPHHKEVVGQLVEHRNSLNNCVYIGWDLTNIPSLQYFSNYWHGYKHRSAKLSDVKPFDIMLYDDLIKRESLIKSNISKHNMYLPITQDFQNHHNYNLEISPTKNNKMVFFGSLKDSTRVKKIERIKKNLPDFLEYSTKKIFEQEKFKFLMPYKYLIDISRYETGMELILLPTVRIAIAIHLGILPISIYKYKNGSGLYKYVPIDDVKNFIEKCENDESFYKENLNQIREQWNLRGDFSKYLKVILNKVESIYQI